MTIEIERTEPKCHGLKKSVTTKVLEFRSWTQKASPTVTYASHSDMLLLHMGPVEEFDILPHEYVFAHPLSEDDLEIITKDNLLEDGETVLYFRKEINQANIVGDHGERLTWRETKSEDYPPLKPEQVLTPIQQILGLK